MKISFKPFTWAKFTGILSAVIALLLLITLLAATKSNTASFYKEAKKNLASYKEDLKTLQKEKEELATPEQLAEVERLNGAIDTAEEELDKVCSRSYFSTSRYSECYYSNNGQCESLHNAVETAKNNLETYLTDNNLSDYEYELDSLNRRISTAESNLESAEIAYASAKKSHNQLVFGMIATVIRLAAMVLLALCLLSVTVDKKLSLVSMGLIALSALLRIFVSNVNFLVNPYFWDLLLCGIFALILWKGETLARKQLVALRVVAIVLALLQFPGSLFFVSPFIAPLSLVFMILYAFVLVPIQFKEYIKIALHIFLSIITLGIWLLVWTYHTTKNLNRVQTIEQRNAKNELLLYLFLPFYAPYFLYKNAEYVEFYGLERGKTFNKISILCFIIGFFCPLMSTILMQDKINLIVGKPEPAPEIAEPQAE